MMQLEVGSRLGWSDAFLIVATVSVLLFTFLLQLSPQPDAFLDSFLDACLHGLAIAAQALPVAPAVWP